MVGEGRVRGDVKQPIELAVPKFDPEIGAYVTPDGGAVELRGDQLVEVPMPVVDGGVPYDMAPILPVMPTTVAPRTMPMPGQLVRPPTAPTTAPRMVAPRTMAPAPPPKTTAPLAPPR
jgi:hypothetical protein